MSPLHPPLASFVVRVRCEHYVGDDGRPVREWRFELEDVDTRDTSSFQDPSAIGEFLRRWIARYDVARPSH
jgi:hypothetical protein